MKKVLIVENNAMVAKVLRHVISQSSIVQPIFATSFAEAKEALQEHQNTVFVALVDVNLPDAPNGEVVDYTLSQEIPTIVLTDTINDENRSKLMTKGIVDYVSKDGKTSYLYALNVIHRLVKNQSIKVLVVDDSNTSRKLIKNLLRLHLFQVIEAEDGIQAIKAILENKDIKLLLTDYHMPRMNGFELVKNIRCKYEKTNLAIIGLSSESEETLSAIFLKNGANDFLKKPFNHEEFFCRVSNNIESLELIETIRDIAYRDDLTELHNRKYFFEKGLELHRTTAEDSSALALAVIDLDNFTSVNDSFGNDVGDYVIKIIADRLRGPFKNFLITSAGGQAFFVLMPGLSNDKALEFIETVRQLVGGVPIDTGNGEISVTFSAGVSNIPGESLDSHLASAMACLKRAKEAGGDLVFGDD